MFELDGEAVRYGVTPVENSFLMDYLPAARGDYVKVYLWGLFACACKGPEYTLEEMAQELFMTVPEVEAALRYWERRALVTRVSDAPPSFRFYSPMQRASAPAALRVDMEYVGFAEAVYAAFGDKRKVSPGEIALAWEWVKDVGLTPEAVLMLLHHCMAQRGPQFSFKAAEKLAVSMKEAGVVSPEDAESFLQHNQSIHEGVRKVLSRMGKRRLASDDELALYEKWLSEWQFEPQAILDACREMTSGDPSFKYLDSILNGLRARSGARTGEQVARQLEQERAEKDQASSLFSALGVKLTGPAAALEYRELSKAQPHAVLLLAAEECRRKGKNLEYMHWLAEDWQKKGYCTEEAVKEYLDKRHGLESLLREVFEACGHRGNPTVADLMLYKKWHEEWGYDQEMICAAAQQASSAEGGKIPYLNKVLEAWHEAGITEVSQVQERKAPAARGKTKSVSAQQYTQREYTEAELLSVSDDLIEEARKYRGKSGMGPGDGGA